MQIDNKLTRTNIFLQLCITRVYSKLTFFNRKTLQYYNESHGNTNYNVYLYKRTSLNDIRQVHNPPLSHYRLFKNRLFC